MRIQILGDYVICDNCKAELIVPEDKYICPMCEHPAGTLCWASRNIENIEFTSENEYIKVDNTIKEMLYRANMLPEDIA